MSNPVSSIRNLGPAVQAACDKAGITSAQHLRDLGADEAYKRLVLNGTKPHFIGYYALVMGLQGRSWNDCKGDEKKALRLRFDTLKAQSFDPDRAGFESMLDQIGVVVASKTGSKK